MYLLVDGISVTYSIFDKYCLMLVDFLSVCHLKTDQMSYIWFEIYLFYIGICLFMFVDR